MNTCMHNTRAQREKEDISHETLAEHMDILHKHHVIKNSAKLTSPFPLKVLIPTTKNLNCSFK